MKTPLITIKIAIIDAIKTINVMFIPIASYTKNVDNTDILCKKPFFKYLDLVLFKNYGASKLFQLFIIVELILYQVCC